MQRTGENFPQIWDCGSQASRIHFCKRRRQISQRIRATIFLDGFNIASMHATWTTLCNAGDKSVSCIFCANPGGKMQTLVYFKRRQTGEGGQARLSRGAIFRQFRVITFACEIAIIRSPGGLGRCTLCKGQSLPYTSSLFVCLGRPLFSFSL